MAESPLKVTVEAGKLVGYEVYRSGGELLKSVSLDKPISNYMNPIMLSRLSDRGALGLADEATVAWRASLAGLVRFSQLGTGASANPRADQSLEAPILSRVDGNTAAEDTGTAVGGFKRSDVNYTHTYCRQIPVVDQSSGDTYNTVRTRWRISHRHALVPATQTTPLVIAEIGWSDSATGVLSSRIVLPEPQRITLEADQFLVTIYEIEGILPDMLIRPFSGLNIAGAFTWGNLSTYSVDELVTHNNIKYKSLINNNIGNVPDASPAAWEAVDPATPLTLSGQYVFRGAYPKHTAPVARILGIHAWACLFGWYYSDNSYNCDILSTGNPADFYNSSFRDRPTYLAGYIYIIPTSMVSLSGIILTEGNGYHPGDIATGIVFPDDTLVRNQNEAAAGKLTITVTKARDSGPTMIIRSIFIFGFQFLLDRPIHRASDQPVTLTATIQWALAQEV